MEPNIYLLIILTLFLQYSSNHATRFRLSNENSNHILFLQPLMEVDKINTSTNAHGPRCQNIDFHGAHKRTYSVISHYSIHPEHFRRRSTKIKYAFAGSVKQNARHAIVNALREWMKVTPFRFFRVKNMVQADISISFEHGDHGDELPFGTPHAGVAHTILEYYYPDYGEVHFDADRKWASNRDPSAFDIQFIALHEFGHVLGLGHSKIKEAVMYEMVCHGERKHLHQDDITRIKALYKF